MVRTHLDGQDGAAPAHEWCRELVAGEAAAAARDEGHTIAPGVPWRLPGGAGAMQCIGRDTAVGLPAHVARHGAVTWWSRHDARPLSQHL
eukprot:COSAG02_NODE_1545_length_11996_cov_6.889636_5_plen_90_part_00